MLKRVKDMNQMVAGQQAAAAPATGPDFDTQQSISQMQLMQVRPGTTVHGKADPNNPAAVWLDLTRVS